MFKWVFFCVTPTCRSGHLWDLPASPAQRQWHTNNMQSELNQNVQSFKLRHLCLGPFGGHLSAHSRNIMLQGSCLRRSGRTWRNTMTKCCCNMLGNREGLARKATCTGQKNTCRFTGCFCPSGHSTHRLGLTESSRRLLAPKNDTHCS